MMTDILQELNKHLGKERGMEVSEGGGQREKTEGRRGKSGRLFRVGGIYIKF